MRPDINRLVVHPEQAIDRLAECQVCSVVGEDVLIILEIVREGMILQEAILVLRLFLHPLPYFACSIDRNVRTLQQGVLIGRPILVIILLLHNSLTKPHAQRRRNQQKKLKSEPQWGAQKMAI